MEYHLPTAIAAHSSIATFPSFGSSTPSLSSSFSQHLAPLPSPSSFSSIFDLLVFCFHNSIFTIYVSVVAILCLLSIAYILHSILASDKGGIKATMLNVFSFMVQVFLEHVTFSGHFSLSIRIFVAIFYHMKYLFTLTN